MLGYLYQLKDGIKYWYDAAQDGSIDKKCSFQKVLKILGGIIVCVLLLKYSGVIAETAYSYTLKPIVNATFNDTTVKAGHDVYMKSMPFNVVTHATGWNTAPASPSSFFDYVKWLPHTAFDMFIVRGLSAVTYPIRFLVSHNMNWFSTAGWVGNAETAVKSSVQQGLLMPLGIHVLMKSGFQPDNTNPDVDQTWAQWTFGKVKPVGGLMYKMLFPLWPFFGRPTYFDRGPLGTKYIDDKLIEKGGDWWKHGMFGKYLPETPAFLKRPPHDVKDHLVNRPTCSAPECVQFRKALEGNRNFVLASLKTSEGQNKLMNMGNRLQQEAIQLAIRNDDFRKSVSESPEAMAFLKTKPGLAKALQVDDLIEPKDAPESGDIDPKKKDSESGSTSWIWWIIIPLLLLLIAFAVYWFFFRTNPIDEEEELGEDDIEQPPARSATATALTVKPEGVPEQITTPSHEGDDDSRRASSAESPNSEGVPRSTRSLSISGGTAQTRRGSVSSPPPNAPANHQLTKFKRATSLQKGWKSTVDGLEKNEM